MGERDGHAGCGVEGQQAGVKPVTTKWIYCWPIPYFLPFCSANVSQLIAYWVIFHVFLRLLIIPPAFMPRGLYPYIVFVFPFVCSFVRTSVTFVRTSVTFVEFASKFCVKVSQVVYISATTHQKAFIFGP